MPPALPKPCLCLVTDPGIAQKDLVERVAQAVAGGVDLVQLRDKEMPGGQLLDLAAQLLKAIDGRAKLLVNERADVAHAAGAHGVQIG
ncbi:MAG TPA: thiamine phosphate synthase, partial [Dehalococcoidia bacterium]|nr:thiamine phosphate synthase [Dehalococcoidia bacterium]